ncbi:unnamed protein product, partial [Iphiclides podalirius]
MIQVCFWERIAEKLLDRFQLIHRFRKYRTDGADGSDEKLENSKLNRARGRRTRSKVRRAKASLIRAEFGKPRARRRGAGIIIIDESRPHAPAAAEESD